MTAPTSATVTLNGLDVTLTLDYDPELDDVIATVAVDPTQADLDPMDGWNRPRKFIVRDWR